MRLDNAKVVGGCMEEVIVNGLTKNYLKFQSHYAGIRPKVMVFMQEGDGERYKEITGRLNDFLLHGASCEYSFVEIVKQGKLS